VNVTAKTSGKIILLTVYDNGIGIEETILNKIFDPFFTTKTTGEAAGVGLYLSREIIQNHGGDISAASVKNEYSEFTITLPALTA
jgi:signal transduction histidine kinase